MKLQRFMFYVALASVASAVSCLAGTVLDERRINGPVNGQVEDESRCDIAKWDSNMAVEKAVVTNGLKWIDGMFLPIEGRAFDGVEWYYG